MISLPGTKTKTLTYSNYLYGLSGTLWPIHLKPLDDELLSSWIIRLAHAHGYKIQTMCLVLFGRNSAIWNRDIDRLAPPEVIDALARISGASVEQIEKTTLRSYEGVMFERHVTGGICRWLVPLGVFHRSRSRPGLMFCPQCLRDDATPYFRRRWRLASSTICANHKGYLLDACPKCAAPIAPHRSDMQGRQLYPSSGLKIHCWQCGFDLRISAQEIVLDERLIALQAQIDSVLSAGYVNWAGNPSMHSIIFFDGLHQLISGITSNHTQKRLLNFTRLSGITLNDWPYAGLESARLSMRQELFRLLVYTLDNWPINFSQLIHEYKLRYADLKGDSTQLAGWYEDVIQREGGAGRILITHDEAEAIARAVETRHGHFSGDMARKISGHDINSHVPEWLPQPVSDDIYEDLLTSIDHQIAGTFEKTERASLIRDKIMFAVGRQLGLSEGKLAALTLVQLRELVPEEVELSFSKVARTPGQTRAWVEWYWNKMRPQLMPRPDIQCVFTSARTRRGFGHSAVGVRFQRAVEAGMIKSIPSYRCWTIKLAEK